MDQYTNTLKSSGILKKSPTQIIDIISKGCDVEVFPTYSAYREIHDIVRSGDVDSVGFLKFLKSIISRKGDPVKDIKYIKALYEMYNRSDKWVRDISTWKRKSYNVENQVASIGRHLFCDYDVPKFMDSVWYWRGRNLSSFNGTWVNWYIHIGQGGNIRTIVPVKLTKKMAHNFLLAPDNYNPDNAIRWGQVFGLGGDERLVKTICESNLGQSFENDDFWVTIIHFFVRNPMIDVVQISPIIDYITHLKYTSAVRFPMKNNLFTYKPINRDFEIKGRSVDSLMRGMEKWHIETGKDVNDPKAVYWERFVIDDYQISFGKDNNKLTYFIKQLLNAKSVKKEGSTHGHCVGSYVQSCATGRTSIWSMSFDNHLGINKPLLTIELNNNWYICEIRGKRNRLATKYELSIIEKWASENKLFFRKRF